MGRGGDLREVIDGLIQAIDKGCDRRPPDTAAGRWVRMCSGWVESLGSELLVPCRLVAAIAPFVKTERTVLQRPARDAPLLSVDQSALLASWRSEAEEEHALVPPSVALVTTVCTWVPLQGERSEAECQVAFDSNFRVLVGCLARHLESCAVPENFTFLIDLICDSYLPNSAVSHLRLVCQRLGNVHNRLVRDWAIQILKDRLNSPTVHQVGPPVSQEIGFVASLFSQLLAGEMPPRECAQRLKGIISGDGTGRGNDLVFKGLHVRLALSEVERPDCGRALILELVANEAIPPDSCLLGLDEDLHRLLEYSHELTFSVAPDTTSWRRLSVSLFGGDAARDLSVGVVGFTERHLARRVDSAVTLCLELKEWSGLEELLDDVMQLSLSECGQELFTAWGEMEPSYVETELAPLLTLCRTLEDSKQRWIAQHILGDILPFSCGQLAWELFAVVATVLVSQSISASCTVAAATTEEFEVDFGDDSHQEQLLLQHCRSISLTWIKLLETIVTSDNLDIIHFLLATNLYKMPSLWMIRGTFSHSVRLLCRNLDPRSTSAAGCSAHERLLARLVDHVLVTTPIEVIVAEMDLITVTPVPIPMGEGGARLRMAYDVLIEEGHST